MRVDTPQEALTRALFKRSAPRRARRARCARDRRTMRALNKTHAHTQSSDPAGAQHHSALPLDHPRVVCEFCCGACLPSPPLWRLSRVPCPPFQKGSRTWRLRYHCHPLSAPRCTSRIQACPGIAPECGKGARSPPRAPSPRAAAANRRQRTTLARCPRARSAELSPQPCAPPFLRPVLVAQLHPREIDGGGATMCVLAFALTLPALGGPARVAGLPRVARHALKHARSRQPAPASSPFLVQLH